MLEKFSPQASYDFCSRASGIISKEIAGFLEVNQKLLEIFLAPRALAGFRAVWLWVGRPLQIWGACLNVTSKPPELSPPSAAGARGSGGAASSELERVH